jgi:RecA/RadA recombinase
MITKQLEITVTEIMLKLNLGLDDKQVHDLKSILVNFGFAVLMDSRVRQEIDVFSGLPIKTY